MGVEKSADVLNIKQHKKGMSHERTA